MLAGSNRLTRESVETGRTQRSVFKELTEATTLSVGDAFVHVTGNTATDDWSLTLPAVGQAAGMIVTIQSTIANSKTVTVQDQDDSVGWSDIPLDTDADYCVLYCDGVYWHTLVDGVA